MIVMVVATEFEDMREKIKYVKFLLIVLFISMLLMIVQSSMNAINILLTLTIEPIVYFIFTYMVLQRGEKKGYNTFLCTIAVFLGRIAIELPIRIKDFEPTMQSILPPICCIISIFVAYLYYRYKHKAIPIVILGSLIWIYCIFYGQTALSNYRKFGHVSSSVHISNAISNTVIYKSDDDSLSLKDLKYKYLFLDFWNSGCGYCYETFPALQKLYGKYKSRNDVFIGSVFVAYRNNETPNAGDSILRKKNYSFLKLATNQHSEFFGESGVKVYPTVLILDEKKTIIFIGNFDKASKKLEELLND